MATIDERLDALTQSVERMAHENRAIQVKLDVLATHLDTVVSAISTLAEIVRSHEKRISDLEGE